MINYLKLFYQYLLKRKTFFILFLTAVVPSIIAGVALVPFSEMAVFVNPSAFRGMSFFSIYWHLTGYGSLWFLKFLALLLFCMMVAVLVATVDRHMRIGDLRIRNPLTRINENIWVVLPVFVAFLLIKEVFDILFSLIVYLCLPLDVTLGSSIMAIAYLAVYFGFSVVSSMLVMWVPHSFNTGLSVPKSLASSVRLASGHIINLSLMIFIGISVSAVLMLIGIAIGGVFTMLTSSITYFSLSIYFVVLMYVVYYDTTGIEREDINHFDIWDQKHDL